MVRDLYTSTPCKVLTQGTVQDAGLTYLLKGPMARSVTSAIDVLSAGSHHQDYVRTTILLETSILFIRDRSRRDAEAKTRELQASKRSVEIRDSVDRTSRSRIIVAVPRAVDTRNEIAWTLKEPLERHLPPQQDVIYDTPDAILHVANRDSRLD